MSCEPSAYSTMDEIPFASEAEQEMLKVVSVFPEVGFTERETLGAVVSPPPVDSQEHVEELKVWPEEQSDEVCSPESSPQQWVEYHSPPTQLQAEDDVSGSITEPSLFAHVPVFFFT